MDKKLIRMCVVCRKRDKQYFLNRLQCINNELVRFRGKGRSFYVCNECVSSKKFINFLAKKCNKPKEEIKKLIIHFPFSISQNKEYA